ncbi:class I SAM-dependent methyltransferase [Streptomyces sp. NPDC091292]|uniref:class I SAM-dependent methyltransferase n=1 Tax=Streptomyces sp. NPDC091292 TaxID=3365991 RepID=UPI003809E1F9
MRSAPQGAAPRLGALLDDTKTYACGYWTSDRPGYTVADARRDRLNLIARSLRLAPDARLLDLGCGWGTLALYAAERHKTLVTAVTADPEQAAHVRQTAREKGLEDRIDVRCGTFRDLTDSAFDAVAAVARGEHGDREPGVAYADFAAALHRKVRPGGRVLVQQLGPVPVRRAVALLDGSGLEVRSVESLREHYARTVAAWHRTLERYGDAFAQLAGPETAREWQLHLAGAAGEFGDGPGGVDQILCTRPDAASESDGDAESDADGVLRA